MNRLLATAIIFLISQRVVLAATDFQQVRLWAAPDHTRVVFDTSGPVSHEVFSLSDPNRIVLDIQGARLGNPQQSLQAAGGLVKNIRAAQNSPDVLRIVLELNHSAKPRTFQLAPSGKYGHRVVIDLYDTASADATKSAGNHATGSDKPATVASASPVPVRKAATAPQPPRHRQPVHAPEPLRDLVIAIDAGHGGDDPGAIGRNRTREKDVTLEIARRLAALVEKEPGMHPVLTRKGDYYIGLRQRIVKAREDRADLFVSIHADACNDHRVSGSSVFVLSRRGASSEMARVLAERENAADLVGGVSLDDKDDLLREVLLDLSQTATLEASFNVAGSMLDELQQVGKAHKQSVQQAGFVVLKSPDIPSLLVETAFISNPVEEKKLRDSRHQQQLAQAMMRGIRNYFGKHPPPGTRVTREYVVKSGDTLSEIADQFRVNTTELRGYNSLKSDNLRVGDTLRIPPVQDS
jgi:N-acetylmuramoyl-L-alanine amidase